MMLYRRSFVINCCKYEVFFLQLQILYEEKKDSFHYDPLF